MSLTQKLHDLFLLDQRVRGINGRLESADRRLQAQQAKLAQLTQQYVEMDDQLKHALVRTSELEKQAAELDDRINHQREVMNTVNNNKEYSALLIEVNTFKNDKSRIEDAALEQMTAVDSLRQEQEELESRVQQQRKLVAVAQTEVETCREDVSDQLEELTSQREAALDDLPGEMQSIFSRLVHIHEGDAVATVVEENRRRMEYFCGGCYMSIPVETVSSLMGSAKDIVLCPNCERMLVIEKALKEAIVK